MTEPMEVRAVNRARLTGCSEVSPTPHHRLGNGSHWDLGIFGVQGNRILIFTIRRPVRIQ